MNKATVEMAVLASQYSGFNPETPEASIKNLMIAHLNENGVLPDFWGEQGYTQVGTATVAIEFIDRADVTANAVAALEKQKKAVLAEAHAKSVEIDRQIQTLLAITDQ